MKIKYLSRKDWRRVLSSDVTFCEKHLPGLRFVSSLYRIHEVTQPLILPACGQMLCMADKGYAWLHILPENQNWCLTAMFNDRGQPIQYYFDITQDNLLDGESSCFTDLYLDIVCLPDGRTEIIDQTDLDEAFADGTITQTQYDLARLTANTLQPRIVAEFARLSTFCKALYDELSSYPA